MKIIIAKDQRATYDEYGFPVFSPPNIRQLFQEVRTASMVVTQDSGFMHIARYYDVPTVALFGPTDPGVFSAGKAVALRASGVSCSPCHDGRAFRNDCRNNVCMKMISPSTVAAKIVSLYGGIA